MERQIPKNVRQIGNVSGSPKIYVEDYVDTFFAQLCEKAGENPTGAFLIGDIQKTEEEEYVYIYGAVRMHELKMSGAEYVIDDETWKHAYEDCKQYFEDGEMLGWFVTCPGTPLLPDINVLKLHKKSFPKQNTIFIMKDPAEKEEVYYVHRFNDLMAAGGHYTYYEKNPCMQNYMISARKKNGVCASETVEDRAAKDFRSLVRSREERLQQKRANRAMYMMSTCLVLVVVIMGVVTMNNFDRMQSVQNSLDSLSGSVVAGMEDKESDVQSKDSKEEDKLADLDDVDPEEGKTDSEGESAEENAPEDVSSPGENITASDEENGQALENENSETEKESEEDGEITGPVQDVFSPNVQSVVPQNVPDEGTDGDAYVGEDNFYEVEEGDTLAMISQKIYGDTSYVGAISEINGLTDGNLIYVGQKLLLP